MTGPVRLLLAILALVAGLWTLPAAAQDFPARPAGPVLDAAGVLPDDREAALDAKLREYNRTTGRAVVVATVPSLDGLSADVYAQQLAETWDIGGATTEEGVLLLVAPNEREVWITTARGVQVRLTDVAAGRIVRDTIVPSFKAGDMPGGIVAGVDAIVERLDLDPATAKAIDEAEAAAQAQRGEAGGAATVAGAAFWVMMILFFMFAFGRRRARGRRGHVAGAVGDVILWSAINAAMNSGDRGGGWGGGGWGGGSGGGGFGGFGGGGGGFNGGGAGGSW